MRQNRKYVLCCCALALGACERHHDRGAQQTVQNDRVEIAGTLDQGDAESDWSAHFSGEHIVAIDERVAVGDYGDFTATFRFDDGELVHYEKKGRQRDNTGAMVAVESQFAFADGVVVAATGTVNGKTTDPEAVQSRGVLRRGAALLEQARLQRQRPAPFFRCQGNEPFWHLEIRDRDGLYSALGDEEKKRPLAARWQWSAANSADMSLSWSARQSPGGAFFVRANIVKEQCLDTMSDETPPFGYSVTMQRSSGDTVSGCCRLGRRGATRLDD